ncbi:Uncharacterized protein EJ110_NYTH27414 [Nymphaea thermarum]|nr:Uncharacterized protein EJ110_NYTH27414 [Nymphaea thermarum]
MGGGNGQKSRMAREKQMEKMKTAKGEYLSLSLSLSLSPSLSLYLSLSLIRSSDAGSQLETNKKAMTIQCKVCMQTFMCTTSEVKCREHAEAKHPKNDLYQCFPHLKS